MRRIAMIGTTMALAAALVTAPRSLTTARGQTPPPDSNAFGKTLTEWMQLAETWLIGGGQDHVGKVTFLPLPNGDYAGGSFIYGDPGIRTVTSTSPCSGTPFVLPVMRLVRRDLRARPRLPG